jgi:signal transduction histidine kinase
MPPGRTRCPPGRLRYDGLVTAAPSPPEPAPPTPIPPAAIAARRLSTFCGILVIAVGLVVLVGWTLQMPVLTGLFGTITMKTNAAIALVLCGAGVLLISRLRIVAAGFGLLAGTLGAVTLAEHVSGWDAGIDQALFTEAAGAIATASPNRMGLNACISVLLGGTALMLLATRHPRAAAIGQRLSFGAMALALLALAGYIYGVEQLYAVARFTGIAWHMALALLLLHVGIVSAYPEAGPTARFISHDPAGTMLRRLAVPVSVVPFVAGYLVLVGHNAGLYDSGMSMTLLALALVLVLWLTVWHTAEGLELLEQQRFHAEQARDDLLVREREARDEAERANHLKDQFIATMSHELRTPLNVMLGWTKVLESRERADQHPRAASVVARNGRLLARLIEDLLDISRATAGQFEITRTTLSINALAQSALDAIAPVAAAKRIHLTADLEPADGWIQADADRLQQVLSNLLSNAAKFTPEGGTIGVRTRTAPGKVQIEVIDSGIGFDQSFAPHLFEPFRQADASARREHGGLGLGLSIARHLVDLHGGSIAAASDGRGTGARFTVTLPAVNVAAAGLAAPEQREAEVAASGPREA